MTRQFLVTIETTPFGDALTSASLAEESQSNLEYEDGTFGIASVTVVVVDAGEVTNNG